MKAFNCRLIEYLTPHCLFLPFLAIRNGFFLFVCFASVTYAFQSQGKGNNSYLTKDLITGEYYYRDTLGISHKTTVHKELQRRLEGFLHQKGNPISALVILEVGSGKVLAMVEGQESKSWGGGGHSALFSYFPAASLFKFSSTIAAVEALGLDPHEKRPLRGGCNELHRKGIWMVDKVGRYDRHMDLRQAFGDSCNGFYAKLVVEFTGLNLVNSYAKKLGWGRKISADFIIPESPIQAPESTTTSIYRAGRYGAGFGMVGLNAVHAAYLSYLVATKGMSFPLILKKETDPRILPFPQRVFQASTAESLKEMMQATVKRGTARWVFRKKRYRKLRYKMSGKTGTLSTKSPKGVTTWFTGLYPQNKPEIAISAVVINRHKWVIKGPQLAAEAVRIWSSLGQKKKT